MVDGLGVDRGHEADIVGHGCKVWQQLGHPCPALSMALEFKSRWSDRQGLLLVGEPSEALAHPDTGREILTGEFLEMRLVVEQVHLGRTSGLEKVNDALGPRGEGKRIRKSTQLVSTWAGMHQSTKGSGPQAQAAGAHELATCLADDPFGGVVHRYSLVTASSRLSSTRATSV